MSSFRSFVARPLLALAALGALAVAIPEPAHAWWRGGGFFIGVPAVVVPPPVYYPPPAYYYPPAYYAPPPVAAPAQGRACYAAGFSCPVDPAIPPGAGCSCPSNQGFIPGRAG